MDVGVTYQDVIEVLKGLPPARVAEVYDFARFLTLVVQRNMSTSADELEIQNAFLNTFGSWQEERSAEDIITDIYASRDTGKEDRTASR